MNEKKEILRLPHEIYGASSPADTFLLPGRHIKYYMPICASHLARDAARTLKATCLGARPCGRVKSGLTDAGARGSQHPRS